MPEFRDAAAHSHKRFHVVSRRENFPHHPRGRLSVSLSRAMNFGDRLYLRERRLGPNYFSHLPRRRFGLRLRVDAAFSDRLFAESDPASSTGNPPRTSTQTSRHPSDRPPGLPCCVINIRITALLKA